MNSDDNTSSMHEPFALTMFWLLHVCRVIPMHVALVAPRVADEDRHSMVGLA